MKCFLRICFYFALIASFVLAPAIAFWLLGAFLVIGVFNVAHNV